MKDHIVADFGRWEPVFLGEVVKLHYGKTLANEDRRPSGRIAVYGANGIKDYADVALTDGPSLIIGRKGSAGEVTRVDGPFWPLDVTYYTSHDDSRIDFDFLEYALSTLDLPSLARGVKPGINRNDVYSLQVPLPPLEEQKRIVAVLDQAFGALDRARANAEANLADTSELFKSELRAAFAKAGTGVELLPFGSLCETITPKVKIQRKDYLGEGAYPIVSQEVDLVSGYCDDTDALMSIGEPVVIFGDHTRCLKYVDFDFVVGADGTKVLRPKKDVAAEYLYFGLRSQPIAETGYARHFKFIREISLPKLRHEDQLTFAHRLSEIESKCRLLQKVYETKLAALSALRQSLLRHAFSGRLTA